jgi:2'-5' RNA ligase
MIWATGKAGEEIGKLKKLIETALVDNTRTYADAKQKSVRDFKMHITLARFKNTTLMSPLILRGGDNIDWRMQVSSFVLYQSHLSPVGADYEVLEEFILNSSTKYPSRPGSRAEADES